MREQEIAEFRPRQAAWEMKETALETELSEMKARNRELQVRMDEEQKNAAEKIAQLQSLEERLNREFQALSAKALRENNEAFLNLAQTKLQTFQAEAKGDLEQRQKAVENLVAPINETLARYDQQVQTLENSRNKDYGILSEQVKSLLLSQQKAGKRNHEIGESAAPAARPRTLGRIAAKESCRARGHVQPL